MTTQRGTATRGVTDTRPRRASARRPFAGVLVAALLLALLGIPQPTQAYPGAPWFEPGKVYRGNFPDPSVIRVDDTFYAYATTTGGAYLPVMSSTDLVNWTARPAYPYPNGYNSDPFLNDGLVDPPEWGLPIGGHPWITRDIEAPGVAQVGAGYVAYYAVAVTPQPGYSERYCLSYATASSPLGPFVDTTAGPFHCDLDPVGSRDPQPYVDPVSGKVYLIWKSEGIVGSTDPKIWIRELQSDGTGWAAGSAPTVLLDGYDQAWEGQVIENPAMIRHDGTYRLFYSGNEWRSTSYAVGYATCTTVTGPCTKHPGNPVLATGAGRNGPGGATPFHDADGDLHLGFHYWNAPYSDYPAFPECQATGTCTTQGQRRFATSPVYQRGDGTLQVGGCPGAAPFPDVASSHTFCVEIDWLKTEGHSTGYADGTFRPNNGTSRGALAAFLYRYAGSPPGPFPAVDFIDITEDYPFRTAVEWMADAGITTGYADDTYRPSGGVNRQQIAAFLHRLAGAPAVTAPDPGFRDVPTSHPFYDEIRWLASTGITTGYADGTFRPTAPVRRMALAAFLHRFDQLP